MVKNYKNERGVITLRVLKKVDGQWLIANVIGQP